MNKYIVLIFFCLSAFFFSSCSISMHSKDGITKEQRKKEKEEKKLAKEKEKNAPPTQETTKQPVKKDENNKTAPRQLENK